MTLTLIQVVVSGLLVGAVYALFSSGLTLIWGMMNVINFGHGDFVMVGMYVAYAVMVWLHGGPGWVGPAAAVLLFGLGVAVYYGLIRPDQKALARYMAGTNSFPHAENWIGGGCVVTQHHANIFACADCKKARARWEEDHDH